MVSGILLLPLESQENDCDTQILGLSVLCQFARDVMVLEIQLQKIVHVNAVHHDDFFREDFLNHNTSTDQGILNKQDIEVRVVLQGILTVQNWPGLEHRCWKLGRAGEAAKSRYCRFEMSFSSAALNEQERRAFVEDTQ